MFQEIWGMERLRKAKPVLLAIAAVCGLLVAVGGGAETPPAAREATIPASPARAHQSGESSGPLPSSLDFETYRTRVEPIFLKQRQGGMRCYDCHSVLATRLRLEPLSPGSSSWTTEQSRRNFKVVSQSDPEWKLLAEWVRQSAEAPTAAQIASPSTVTDTLDFQFFRTKVQPIFLKQRPAHARCYGCHILTTRNFHLEALSPGSAGWTDDQSQRNFQNTLQQVVPGDPASSRLLIHPLAPEAGGDPFHSGGRQFASPNDPDWLALAEWVRGVRTGIASEPAPGAMTRIYVTNSAGDTVDVIDSAKNKIVQVIGGIELPHGIAFSPDGSRVYISNESESVLDVMDGKSGKILQKVSLSGRPNNIAITKDGDRVLAGIRTEPGIVDVIDTTSLKRSKSISVDGSVHNVFVTPDGKYAVSGSIENKAATIIDLQSEQAVWEIKFDSAVRPMAFEANPDGSTSRIFVQLTGLNGFAVVDFAKRAEVARIKLPEQPSGFGIAEGRTGTPSHGIGVAPDGKSLWVNSTLANAVFKYSLPELKLAGYSALPVVQTLGHSPTGAVPEWITFTPDSKTIYVSNSGAGSVSAIDTKSLKAVAVIAVGEVPKRINTLALH